MNKSFTVIVRARKITTFNLITSLLQVNKICSLELKVEDFFDSEK